MYSRKIKQMKKKLLSSSSGSKSSNATYGGGGNFAGGGGGGTNSNWGPRIALYEREQAEARRRRESLQQEEEELHTRQQAIYNSSKNGTSKSGFKNPYATSGIGVHTSAGFICKANKKLTLDDDDDDDGDVNDNHHQSTVPLRLGIIPDSSQIRRTGRGPSSGLRSPPLTNGTNVDSLASTKTYHSSGGSSHSSSSSTLSSRSNSSLGHNSSNNSLTLGSDHHQHGQHPITGNYNINATPDVDDPYNYNHQSGFGAFRRKELHGHDSTSHLVLPQTPSQSISKNIKLITVHQLEDDGDDDSSGDFDRRKEQHGGGRSSSSRVLHHRSGQSRRLGSCENAAGYYSKNLIHGINNRIGENKGTRPVAFTGQKSSNAAASKSSQLMQGFSMVYVPMESAKPAAAAQTMLDTSAYRHRQKVPQSLSSDSCYNASGNTSHNNNSNAYQLPEDEIQEVLIPTMPSPTNFNNGDERQNLNSNPPPPPPATAATSSTADIDSLLESFDSILFKPKLNSNCSPSSISSSSNYHHNRLFSNRQNSDANNNNHHNSNGGDEPNSIDSAGMARKRTPPPLPPKNKIKTNQENSSNFTPPAPSIPPKPKNLRFSEHLDIKSPSPYTTINYADAEGNKKNGNGERRHDSLLSESLGSTTADKPGVSGIHHNPNYQHHPRRQSLDEDGVASTSAYTGGAMSRASVYSACTTTTTLLSCGHLRDTYSTLSSLNSREFTDEDENPQQRDPSTKKKEKVNSAVDDETVMIEDSLERHAVDPNSLEDEDPEISNKSALQQLRDLSILIGGSFHNSPILRANPAEVEHPPVIIKNPQKEESKIHDAKQQVRKCSTETSNDSGKGSATGSGRSRSEGGSAPGSIMQLLQHLSPPPPPSAIKSSNSGKLTTSNANSVLALKKLTATGNGSHQNQSPESAGNSSGGHSCSCDSSLSTCLFEPDCEECQQVFRNPFEILPELKMIESANNANPNNGNSSRQGKLKKMKVLASKKELGRRPSFYKLRKQTKPAAASSSSTSANNPSLPVSSSCNCDVNSSSSTSHCQHCNPDEKFSHNNRRPPQQQQNFINDPNNNCHNRITKTELLLSKSATAKNLLNPAVPVNNIVGGCIGCYNESLLMAAQNGSITAPGNCQSSFINPNLFTIDEAAEETYEQRRFANAATAAAAANGISGSKMKKHSHGHHKSKYGRTTSSSTKKKSSTTKKSHHHHNHHSSSTAKEDKYLACNAGHGHPKCWLATDGSMGWSDLESIYSQNMKNLEAAGGSGGPCGNGVGFLRGECLTCWKELNQYKYNSSSGLPESPDDNNYTVERTKRMFIWLNRRPKEFCAPWWEAKKQASVKWLITKAYSHLPKGSVQHPFKESKKDKTKLCLKEQVMAGLATGKLYCMALENLFTNCTPEERQSIFGPRALAKGNKTGKLMKSTRESQDHHQNDDIYISGNEIEEISNRKKESQQSQYCLSLSHWEIIKILSRKGIYVAQPSDMKLTEGTLRQKKPFRITAHIALIEAIMGLYAKVLLTRERVEPIVANLGYELNPDTQTSEEFILAWVNAVIDTLKAYILSSLNSRKLVPSNNQTHLLRWLNLHPITDLRDLFDGIGICSIFILYFSNELSFEQIRLPQPNEPLSIYDSTLNHEIVTQLTASLFPQIIHHLRLTDLLYIHGYMKQNVLQLLLDIFYYTEIVPIDRVSRLTVVPLRIQL